MSRGFVKEEDQEEKPIIPPRAALPAGAINYVTPHGFEELLKEKDKLETERSSIGGENDKEKRIAMNVLNTKLNMLTERINSAQIIEPADVAGEVRFGTHVKLRFKAMKVTRIFQIVGVDEADVSKGKIAFTSPIASAIMGRKAGETVELSLTGASREVEILQVAATEKEIK